MKEINYVELTEAHYYQTSPVTAMSSRTFLITASDSEFNSRSGDLTNSRKEQNINTALEDVWKQILVFDRISVVPWQTFQCIPDPLLIPDSNN